jgi:hypothetical protein
MIYLRVTYVDQNLRAVMLTSGRGRGHILEAGGDAIKALTLEVATGGGRRIGLLPGAHSSMLANCNV